MKTNYDVTIGYRAVICATIKAESEEQARETALKEFEKFRSNANKGGNLQLSDDTVEIAGVLDLDKSWNIL